MKLINQPIQWSGSSSVVVGANVTSDAIDIRLLKDLAMRIAWDAGLTGTITLEAALTDAAPTASDWTTITGSDQATLVGDGAGSHLVQMFNVQYTWLRIVYTYSAGAANMSATFSSKHFLSLHR